MMRLPRLLSLSAISVTFLCTAALLSQAQASSQSAAASRIVSPIDEKQLTTLKGSVHPLAKAANDRGAVADSMKLDRLHLVLKRSDAQESALRQLITEMHTPGTANYHKWLTPDQFGRQFGPSDQDVAAVQSWLGSHGFSVTGVNPGRQTIEFSGSAAQLREAFHTQIHQYQVNSETHFANATDPQIPSALASVVGGFVSLNNFRVKSYARKLGQATYDPKTDKATPQWTIGSAANGYSFVLAPGDFAVQYDLNPLYTAGVNGTGQTIAIINDSNINVALANQFRTLFGLPANPPQVIIDGNDPGVDGNNNPDGPNYDSVEAYLDVEWAGAVAPNATIDLVIGGDTALESGLILAAEHAVYGNIAPVMSLSFGNCESSLGSGNAFFSSLWEQAAAQGITVMVSTGDAGSAGCDNDNSQYYAVNGQAVNGFASTPFNVGVGGTDFYYSNYNSTSSALSTQIQSYWSESASNSSPAVSIKGVIPEQPWNDSQYGLNIFSEYASSGNTATSIAGGSGGASAVYTAKPAWQTGTGVPADGVRDLPDVSLFASSGVNASYYPICAVDGDCQPATGSNTVQISGVGGTSASSPAFAAMMALVNQKTGQRQGQADYILYPLAKQFPAAFHDVTVGTNSVPCAIGSTNCIAVSNPLTVSDPNYGTATEGQIGVGTTAEYNAGVGYDLASGLGTIDAAQLVNNWSKVTLATSKTTLVPSQTTFARGTSITLNGTVTGSGTPSGDVALMTSSTEPGNQGEQFFTLSNGSFTGTTSTLPGGTYTIWGQYGGDTANAESSSTPVQITVTPETPGINLNIFAPASTNGYFTPSATPGNSVDYGTQLALSALVAPTADLTALQACSVAAIQQVSGVTCPSFTSPTGTVTFKDTATGGSLPATAVINSEGDAEFNAPFTVGAHSVTASYAGDATYNAVTSSAIPFTVVKDTPTMGITGSITDSKGNYLTSQANVFSVQVEDSAQYLVSGAASVQNPNCNSPAPPVPIAAPTGTVTVSGFPSGVTTSASLIPAVDPCSGAVEGVGTITAPSTTPAGTYTVTLTYPGDANYASTSLKTSVAIKSYSGQTSVTSATVTGSISPTSSITIAGTVTGVSGHPAPTGTVVVFSSGYNLGQVNITAPSSGVASTFSLTLDSQNLFQGANYITLQYVGDTVYLPSEYTLNSGSAVNNSLSDFTMVPSATIWPLSAGVTPAAPDIINLASVNGFSGNVTLTCTPVPGISCSIASPAALTAGGTTTAALALSAQADTANLPYSILVTGVDASGKYVHTLNIQGIVSGSPVGSSSFALTNVSSILVAPGATSGNSTPITVTPLGGFTGSVALACAVTPPSGASTPATCSVSPSVTLGATQTATLTVNSTSSTSAGVYTFTVTGKSGAITITSSLTVSIGVPSFAFPTTAIPAITIATPGGSGTSTFTLTPTFGFAGTVSLTCSIAPTAASDPASCSFSPASVTFTSSSAAAQNITLTVNTTAATALNKPVKLFWPATGGLSLAVLLFFGLPKRRRGIFAALCLLAILAGSAAIGCGGSNGGSSSGGGGSSGNPGTSTGNYTVTVTGTSGSTVVTSTVALTIN